MIFVPATSQKPSIAALPVSPEVAVRIKISSSTPHFFFAAVIRCGSIESATSLKALVGPRNSSSTVSSPTGTVGVRSSVSNLPVYAAWTSCSISACVKSGSSAHNISVAMPCVESVRQRCQSKSSPERAGMAYSPPSGARPFRIASALDAVRAAFRVL